MVLFLVFILFLFLESFLLPALFGPGPFLITPLLLISMIIYGESMKKSLIVAAILALMGEWVVGRGIGMSIIPLVGTATIYAWSNHYLDLKSGFKNSYSFSSHIISTLVLLFFAYVYSWLFILIKSSFNIAVTWNNWLLLFNLATIFQLASWSLAIIIIFVYVFKTK